MITITVNQANAEILLTQNRNMISMLARECECARFSHENAALCSARWATDIVNYCLQFK